MQPEFWVIGGEYLDFEFTRLVNGTAEVFGPFSDYRQAMDVWRERSMASRHQALMRFTIAANDSAEKQRRAQYQPLA